MPGTDPAHRKIQLRDYQRECLEAIMAAYRSGVRRQLTCLPTGSGKTVIFAEFPRYFQMQNQMLVLAHRAELLEQACNKIPRANPGLFGFSEKFDLEGHTTDEVQQAIRWVEAHRPWISIDQALSLSDLRYRCRRIDLLDLETPVELLPYSRFAWIALGKGGYRLGLAGGKAITVAPTILGEWEAVLRQRGKETIIGRGEDIHSAIKNSEAHVSKHLTESIGLVTRNTRWRRAPASDKQLRVLRSKKIKVPEGLTKGQASHLISMLP